MAELPFSQGFYTCLTDAVALLFCSGSFEERAVDARKARVVLKVPFSAQMHLLQLVSAWIWNVLLFLTSTYKQHWVVAMCGVARRLTLVLTQSTLNKDYLKQAEIEGFADVLVAEKTSDAFDYIIQGSGLGVLKHNTVCVLEALRAMQHGWASLLDQHGGRNCSGFSLHILHHPTPIKSYAPSHVLTKGSGLWFYLLFLRLSSAGPNRGRHRQVILGTHL